MLVPAEEPVAQNCFQLALSSYSIAVSTRDTRILCSLQCLPEKYCALEDAVAEGEGEAFADADVDVEAVADAEAEVEVDSFAEAVADAVGDDEEEKEGVEGTKKQSVSRVAPGADVVNDAGHSVHSDAPPLLCVPRGHNTGAALPPEQNAPAGHTEPCPSLAPGAQYDPGAHVNAQSRQPSNAGTPTLGL